MQNRWMLALVLALTAVAAPEPADASALIYEGKLQDGRRKPVGGVFPLSFSLHKRDKGGRALWSETHFVAVDSGRYVVELGSKRPLPPGLALEKMYLGVALTGGDEILREKVDPKAVRKDAAAGAAAQARPTPAGAAAGKKVVDYAETAGLAFEAEHAKVADRIGGLTVEDLEEKLEKSGSKARVGGSKRYTSSAGGEGGVAYEVNCPKGYVVTGVRGGSGIYLDSIQLICSPLE